MYIYSSDERRALSTQVFWYFFSFLLWEIGIELIQFMLVLWCYKIVVNAFAVMKLINDSIELNWTDSFRNHHIIIRFVALFELRVSASNSFTSRFVEQCKRAISFNWNSKEVKCQAMIHVKIILILYEFLRIIIQMNHTHFNMMIKTLNYLIYFCLIPYPLSTCC